MSWRNLALIAIATSGLIVASCDGRIPQPTATSTMQPVQVPTSTSTPVPDPTPTEEVLLGTVTIWHAWEDDELSVLLQVIDDFKLLHPEVQFDVLYIPFEDLLIRYELSANEGGGPSILIGPDRWGPLLFKAGMIANLNVLAEESWLDSFNPPSIELSRYQQNLIGLPYRISGVVLYRNRDIIPEPSEKFDDMVISAQEATEGDRIGAILERSFFYSGAHLLGLGGNLFNDEGHPVFNDEIGLEWIDLLLSFEHVGLTEFSSDNDALFFMENRVGYLIDGTWKREMLADSVGYDNLVIDPWPELTNGYLSGFVQSRNLYLNPRVINESYDLSWRFCQFFLSPQYQRRLTELGYIPALLDIDVEDRLTSQAMNALSKGKPYPTIPEMDFYITTMDEALFSIFYGSVPPESALNQAAEKISANISQIAD
jgi:arabinogalactan oligomer / maltooligosaccharide transport system substrate-binding protein